MTETVAQLDLHHAIAARIRSAAPFLGVFDLPAATEEPMRDVGELLERSVRAVRADRTPERLWLLYTALCGAFPEPDPLQEGLRRFELDSPRGCLVWLLERSFAEGPDTRPIEIVTNRVIVDVDHTARNNLHTGIQQVIRNVIPVWARDHDLLLTAWDDQYRGLRTLDGTENDRVLHWYEATHSTDAADTTDLPLVVPWRCVVVTPEAGSLTTLPRIIGLAKDSGNHVAGIGYDCIPVVSADMIPWGGAGLFVRYLVLVKHMRRIAAISETATTEFQGFLDTLPAQGLTGPLIRTCDLPAERPATTRHRPADDVPLVLVVGSFEPRKNHLAVLHAAETLWREGACFQLRLIGGMSWGDEVPARIAELTRAGRRVEAWHQVDDATLAQAYTDARFTVFPSLHEGYGLPVAESIAAGTPVITSNFGSTAEIADTGGALTIDPRDDDALIEAMRELLVSDARLDQLKHQITQRTTRTWQHYADELWDFLVEGERETTQAPVLTAAAMLDGGP